MKNLGEGKAAKSRRQETCYHSIQVACIGVYGVMMVLGIMLAGESYMKEIYAKAYILGGHHMYMLGGRHAT